MSERLDEHQPTPEDALARTVAVRRGERSVWVKALSELGAIDRAVYQAVADTASPTLDGPVRTLSNAANYSRLWFGLAGAIAVLGGRRGRRAAVEAVVAIGATSAAVNLGIKPIARRRRPDRASHDDARFVSMPKSTSFPSGHSASAFAFGYAVGRHLPGLAVPVRLLAAGVAYSRVHTGVHYPGDVAIGSVVGAGTAAMVAAAADRLSASRSRSAARFSA